MEDTIALINDKHGGIVSYLRSVCTPCQLSPLTSYPAAEVVDGSHLSTVDVKQHITVLRRVILVIRLLRRYPTQVGLDDWEMDAIRANLLKRSTTAANAKERLAQESAGAATPTGAQRLTARMSVVFGHKPPQDSGGSADRVSGANGARGVNAVAAPEAPERQAGQ